MKKILVIGDSCVDVFTYGKSERLCPDAPVPVFVEEYSIKNGGMAANVFNNLKVLNPDSDFVTNEESIVKTRYIDSKTNHMFLRVDSGKETISHCSTLQRIEWNQYAAVIISDYNKGFLSEEDIFFVCSQNKHVFLDTKKLLQTWYLKVPFIKINDNEFSKSKHLISSTDNIIITLGNKGCVYRGKHFPVEKVEVKDTVGAGDTFIAALAHEFVNTNDIEKAIMFANAQATKAVQKKGVYVINE